MSTQSQKPVEVFYSYAHEDEKLCDELQKHLANLKRLKVIADWYDRDISAGAEWNEEIREHLESAGIILLLVSPDFMNSDYSNDVEIKRAMERHDAGEACVIPVILRPVDWEGAPFSKLQGLPTDAKAITLWENSDEAFVSVVKGIRAALKELAEQSAEKRGNNPEPDDAALPDIDLGSNGKTRGFSVAIKAVTAFVVLAGKEWFVGLLNQPNDPPFRFNARFEFDQEFQRVLRLVIIVIILTAIVAGSTGLLLDKRAALDVAALTLGGLFGAFLGAIVYGIFALICYVRIRQGVKRRKLTINQIVFTIIYIFVPWIPIFAFLWTVAARGGTLRLLLLVILFFLCCGYVVLNFVKAVTRLTRSPWYCVWSSALLPIAIVLSYILFRS